MSALPIALASGLGACSAPADDEIASTGSDGDTLIQGLADNDLAATSRLQAVAFVPSSNPDVTTWAAWVLAPSGPDADPTELLFVNHANPAPIVVHVDTVKGAARILAAPANHRGQDALQSLLDDLAPYGDTAGAEVGTQSLHVLGLVDGVRGIVVHALLSDASKALGLHAAALRETIERYTGNSVYAKLNAFLRDGVVPRDWTKDAITTEAKTLSQALEAIPPVTVESHRWVQVGLSPDGLDPIALSKFLQSVKPGTVYKDAAFFSTTANQTPPPGLFGYATVRFDVKGTSGHDISSVSKVEDEREVLFLPNTRFRVTAVTGEFVDKGLFSTRKAAPKTNAWMDFYAIVGPIFGISESDARSNVSSGLIPNIVVHLEEVP